VEFLRREGEGLQSQELQSVEEVKESLRAWRGVQRERRSTDQNRRSLEEERHRNSQHLREKEANFNDLKTLYDSLTNQLEDDKGRLIDTLTELTSLRNRLAHVEERKEDLQKRVRLNEGESESQD
jgi:chromosome segregation ATPase